MIEFLKMEDLPQSFTENPASREIIDYMSFIESEGATALCGICGGAAAVMIDDGENMTFTYPVSISQENSEREIIDEIFSFCTDCEITPTFIDTPAKKLPLLLTGVGHANIDGDGEYYTVSMKNECMLLDFPPEILYGEVYLSEPSAKNASDYKRLIMDKEHNSFWGDDLRADLPDARPGFFIDEAREEFARGTAITLHATVLSDGENLFIGEGVLYRFDCKRGCEIAVRVLPEYCGRGYGRQILEGTVRIAGEIGISEVTCNIDKRNTPALRFVDGIFEAVGEAEEKITLKAYL